MVEMGESLATHCHPYPDKVTLLKPYISDLPKVPVP